MSPHELAALRARIEAEFAATLKAERRRSAALRRELKLARVQLGATRWEKAKPFGPMEPLVEGAPGINWPYVAAAMQRMDGALAADDRRLKRMRAGR